jgi:hypothetical protein
LHIMVMQCMHRLFWKLVGELLHLDAWIGIGYFSQLCKVKSERPGGPIAMVRTGVWCNSDMPVCSCAC